MSRRAALRRWWGALVLRERRMLLAAAAALSAAVLWSVFLAPALKTLQVAPALFEKADAQLQSMQMLAAQAKVLQGRSPLGRAETLRALESSVQQRLGANAQLNVAGDRITVTFKEIAPDVLAQWLSQARLTARAVVVQASLGRSAEAWGGSVVFNLPLPQ